MYKYFAFFTALISTVLFAAVMSLTNQPPLSPYMFVVINTQLYIVLLLWHQQDQMTNND